MFKLRLIIFTTILVFSAYVLGGIDQNWLNQPLIHSSHKTTLDRNSKILPNIYDSTSSSQQLDATQSVDIIDPIGPVTNLDNLEAEFDRLLNSVQGEQSHKTNL